MFVIWHMYLVTLRFINMENIFMYPHGFIKNYMGSYLGNELKIEWSCDLQGLTNGTADDADLGQGFLVQVLGWGHQCGIPRVDPGILHMFRYRHTNDLSIRSHRIHIDLLQSTDLSHYYKLKFSLQSKLLK